MSSENVSDPNPNEESTYKFGSDDETEERRQPDEGSDDDDVADNSDDDDLSNDSDSDVNQKSHETMSSENVSDPNPNEESTDRLGSDDETEERRQPDEGSDDDDVVDNSDDDDLSNDSYSDVNQKSHETRKKNKLFEGFFNSLDKMSVKEINDQTRQWHCPACQNGAGAIDWYRGLQPLMAHAKTKVSRRVKPHRELAELLDEELRRRGIMVIPDGEVLGQWKGLEETMLDYEIVWPPTVIVTNTRLYSLKIDDNITWLGMGNRELLEMFSMYAVKKARQSYAPDGHCGLSALIFEADAMGYLEAERLHKHFQGKGRDRESWEANRNVLSLDGRRLLHGYLARRYDMECFNLYSQGKAQLQFEMRSHQEKVVGPLMQMSKDYQQLMRLKKKAAKHLLQVEERCEVLSLKLRQNIEEMASVERLFKEQMDMVSRATEEKEKNYERQLLEERAKAERLGSIIGSFGTKEDYKLRKSETARSIGTLLKEVEELLTERENLIEAHVEKKVELKCRLMAEEVKLEEEFQTKREKLIEAHDEKKAELKRMAEDVELEEELMKKFAPSTFEASTSSS